MSILQRLLPSQDIDALLGDINEDARRRSRAWYWAQLAAVLVVGSALDVRRHPGAALRALAVGFLSLSTYFIVVMIAARAVAVLSNGGYYLAGHWLTLPPHQLPPSAFTAFVVNTLGFVIAGWTVARTHRAHGIAMLLPYLVMVTLLALVPLTIIVRDSGPGVRTLGMSGIAAVAALVFASFAGGSLLGGLIGAWPRRLSDRLY